MLADYVLKTAPIWSNRIPYGRREATIFMSKDEKACFADAGLLSDHLDTGIITWWDTIATKIRTQDQQAKNETGRLGERNTIKYERNRTNSEPIWMSIDSNLAGYDIKSRVSEDSGHITHRSKSIHIRLRASGISCNISRVECRANEQSICVPPMVLIQQQKNACCYFTGRATALHPH